MALSTAAQLSTHTSLKHNTPLVKSVMGTLVFLLALSGLALGTRERPCGGVGLAWTAKFIAFCFYAPGPRVAMGIASSLELSVRSYLVGNAGSRPISEAKQPWACLVLRWGTTGEAHVLYSLQTFLFL